MINISSHPFLPGKSPGIPDPLSRYLPPVNQAFIADWLTDKVPPGSWIIDPFTASPRFPIEAARAGYRVLLIANNPVLKFLIEMLANPPAITALRAALADMGASSVGPTRVEPYIKSLYQTECIECNATVTAQSFIWDRDANIPILKSYKCANCGDQGERTISGRDQELAASFSRSGLHRARAMERVSDFNDPDRANVEEALSAYVPRSITGLQFLINKLDNFPEPEIDLLRLILLITFDQVNSIWHYPAQKFRPRQISVPQKFIERNIWNAMEEAINYWESLLRDQTGNEIQVAVHTWPELPPDTGGICCFDGRLNAFMESNSNIHFHAGASVIPRPNQAFWTFSALWSGWLWGRDVSDRFKVGLRRRRYDWSWHTNALHAAFSRIVLLMDTGSPFFAALAEGETGFSTATILAANLAGLDLVGAALRSENNQYQFEWKIQKKEKLKIDSAEELISVITEEGLDFLKLRGEPASFSPMHTLGLLSLIKTDLKPKNPEITPGDLIPQINGLIQHSLSSTENYSRFLPGEHAQESGYWWLGLTSNDNDQAEPLSDRVEKNCVRYLLAHPGASYSEIDSSICHSFPGLFTPEQSLIRACLESYGTQNPEGSENWFLRLEDDPKKRRDELTQMADVLQTIGRRIGYKVHASEDRKVLWVSNDGAQDSIDTNNSGEVRYVFYIVASAVISRQVLNQNYSPSQCVIVCPGGRANLISYKLRANPLIDMKIRQGWRFLKYRHLRRLADSEIVNQDNFDEQLSLDQLGSRDPQLVLF